MAGASPDRNRDTTRRLTMSPYQRPSSVPLLRVTWSIIYTSIKKPLSPISIPFLFLTLTIIELLTSRTLPTTKVHLQTATMAVSVACIFIDEHSLIVSQDFRDNPAITTAIAKISQPKPPVPWKYETMVTAMWNSILLTYFPTNGNPDNYRGHIYLTHVRIITSRSLLSSIFGG